MHGKVHSPHAEGLSWRRSLIGVRKRRVKLGLRHDAQGDSQRTGVGLIVGHAPNSPIGFWIIIITVAGACAFEVCLLEKTLHSNPCRMSVQVTTPAASVPDLRAAPVLERCGVLSGVPKPGKAPVHRGGVRSSAAGGERQW